MVLPLAIIVIVIFLLMNAGYVEETLMEQILVSKIVQAYAGVIQKKTVQENVEVMLQNIDKTEARAHRPRPSPPAARAADRRRHGERAVRAQRS